MAASPNRNLRFRPLIAPLLTASLLYACTFFPEMVELVYGRHLYPMWADMVGTFTGRIPFSLGDLLYILLILMFVRWLFRWQRHAGGWVSMLSTVGWIYVFFQLGWGLNYSRLPIQQRLGLVATPADTLRLPELTDRLLEQTNAYAICRSSSAMPPFDSLVRAAKDGYSSLSRKGVFPATSVFSVKVSLFGRLGNYLGYSGYFNPFTGEAQLNDAVPPVLHPFVIAHEIGHQLGFAREQDANLSGFLAARASPDSFMRYSAYFDMFLYANAVLFSSDSLAGRRLLSRLHPNARKDLDALRSFKKQYRTPVEDIVDVVYDQYLKANGQKDGTRSYGKVVLTLLAIYRKEGGI